MLSEEQVGSREAEYRVTLSSSRKQIGYMALSLLVDLFLVVGPTIGYWSQWHGVARRSQPIEGYSLTVSYILLSSQFLRILYFMVDVTQQKQTASRIARHHGIHAGQDVSDEGVSTAPTGGGGGFAPALLLQSIFMILTQLTLVVTVLRIASSVGLAPSAFGLGSRTNRKRHAGSTTPEVAGNPTTLAAGSSEGIVLAGGGGGSGVSSSHSGLGLSVSSSATFGAISIVTNTLSASTAAGASSSFSSPPTSPTQLGGITTGLTAPASAPFPSVAEFWKKVAGFAIAGVVFMVPFSSGWLPAVLLGYLALGIEATLLIPQLWKNKQRRSCEGISWILISCWIGGDVVKLMYFLVLHQPSPFVACSVTQLLLDAVLIYQLTRYNH